MNRNNDYVPLVRVRHAKRFLYNMYQAEEFQSAEIRIYDKKGRIISSRQAEGFSSEKSFLKKIEETPYVSIIFSGILRNDSGSLTITLSRGSGALIATYCGKKSKEEIDKLIKEKEPK